MSGYRVSFRFSANGRYAVCLTGATQDRLAPLHWTLGDPSGAFRIGEAEETVRTQPMPTDDGRLLLLRHGGDADELVLVETDGTRHAVPVGRGLRLLPSPEPGTLALATGPDGAGGHGLWRIGPAPSRLAPVVTLPGPLGSTGWLDAGGQRLAADLRHGDRVRPIVIDLAAGAWSDLPPAAGGRTQRLLLTAPDPGRLMIASDAPGELRLGFISAADPTAADFPERLNALSGTVRPLAVDPSGRRVALRVARGARSHLFVYDIATDTPTEVALPAGIIHPGAVWGPDGIRLVHSTPDRPADVVTLVTDGDPVAAVPPVPDSGVTVERFTGPGGDFEALCYGDWRTSDGVVVALHGGPEAAWEFGYEPLLRALADAGLAVVAPNQRGSTGYGPAHAAAIHGAWGGPDLDDIRSLVRALRAGRPGDAPAPMAYGASYGAFLALLAAAADPELWSRCAVVASFLSAPSLYAEADRTVRALVDRLRGLGDIDDDLGPRDLSRLAGRIEARLLVVHGELDRTIPVSQARQLRRVLVAAGRTEGTDFVYHEVPGGDHAPLTEESGMEVLVDFLSVVPDRTTVHTG